MKTHNPFLTGDRFQSSSFGFTASDRMTINGTIDKTILMGVLLLIGAGIDYLAFQSSPGLGEGIGFIALILGFVLGIATPFKPQWSPITAPIYGLMEGAALGLISMFYASAYSGIIPAAIGLTIVIFFVMFALYRLGVLRATPMFVGVITFATIGILCFYGLTFLLSFLGVHMGMFYSGSLGIGISVVISIVAAMNLIIDFDFIERGAQGGMPKYMEWYGAFSLTVTLVWLYLEILRLLAQMQSRNN